MMILNIDKKNPLDIAAIDDCGKEISYGELVQFCSDFKKTIGKRTLIFILSENVIGSFVGYIASLSSKIVPLIINYNIDKVFLNNLLNTYSPEYLWIPNHIQDEFSYECVFSRYDYSLLKTDLKEPDLFDDLSLLLPTSGSTGSSKLVRHSYRNIEANAENVANFFEISKDDRALASLPLHYTMGLSIISSYIYSGATVLLVKRSMLEREFWDFFKEQKATSFTGVPYSFEILSKLNFFRMSLPDLKLITQGGGKMSDEMFTAYAKYAENTGKKFVATYGQTECAARMAYLPSELAISKPGSIGIAIPNGRLYLIDDNSGEVIEMPEVTGQMVYEGENVTLGYAYCAEDLMKGDENNGIMKTGDIAKRDSDGCYFIVGRKARFLKLFSYRVCLDECEQIIKSILNIECACLGTDDLMKIYIADERYMTEVKDLLIKKTNLIGSVFKVIIVDSIPKNEVGKIMYAKLK